MLRGAAFAFAAIAIWIALPLGTPTMKPTQPTLYATILAAATLVGIAEVFRDNAAQTMLPALVPQAG